MSNIKNKVFKGETLGVYFGTFAPFHLGHYQSVMRAKKENDACLVIVSGHDGDRGSDIGLGLEKRFRYTRELFADDENVLVEQYDESHIARYPDGWNDWFEGVLNLVQAHTQAFPGVKVKWYVGEPDYASTLTNDYKQEVVLISRDGLSISGTQIRQSPLEYWNYITRPFRRHFSTNILITGTASGGKTTLVKDLARSFGSPFALEYAREYQETSNVRDEELTANDFTYLASGMFDLSRKTIQSPSNNGLFFADSDVLTTLAYSELYLTKEEHEKLLPSYELMLEKEQWDLILIVPPVTPYVDDGFRDMTQSDTEARWAMHDRFLSLLHKYGWSDKAHVLDAEGSPEDKDGFYARYDQSRTIIKDYVQNTQLVLLP